MKVGKNNFRPPPKVESSVVRYQPITAQYSWLVDNYWPITGWNQGTLLHQSTSKSGTDSPEYVLSERIKLWMLRSTRQVTTNQSPQSFNIDQSQQRILLHWPIKALHLLILTNHRSAADDGEELQCPLQQEQYTSTWGLQHQESCWSNIVQHRVQGEESASDGHWRLHEAASHLQQTWNSLLIKSLLETDQSEASIVSRNSRLTNQSSDLKYFFLFCCRY